LLGRIGVYPQRGTAKCLSVAVTTLLRLPRLAGGWRPMAEEFNPTEWITIGEAAALTGYAAAYFRKLIAKGRLRARKRGRDWFLDKAEVLAYAEAMREPGCDKTNPWRPAYNSHAD